MRELTIGKNDAGQRVDRFVSKALPLLPPALRSALAALSEWEKHSLTAALLRVAELCGEVD